MKSKKQNDKTTKKKESEAPSRRECSLCKGTGHNRQTCLKLKMMRDAKAEAEQNAVKEEQSAPPSKIRMWKTACLKVHPLNEAMPKLDGPSFDRLHADIAAHGVDDPLHIVLDEDVKTGLVIAGAERLGAARAAGHEQVPVIIRSDLAADLVKLRRHIVLSNVDRKNLTEGQLVSALLFNEDHLLAERKLSDGGGGGAETGPESKRVSQIMADLVRISATKWKDASSLVRAHEAGEAPIVKLYIDGLIRADRAKKALALSTAEQDDIVEEMKEHADSPIDDRRTIARHLLDKAMQDPAVEAAQDDADQEDAEEKEETPDPARSVGTRSRGAKSKVILKFPGEQVQHEVDDLDQAEGVDTIEKCESEEDDNGVEPEDEVTGSSTPTDDIDIKPEATTAASPRERSPIDVVRAALDKVHDLIAGYVESHPELKTTLEGIAKLRDELPRVETR